MTQLPLLREVRDRYVNTQYPPASTAVEVMDIVPTGKRISWTENEISRLADGRIIESWGEGGLAFKGS